VLEFYIVPQQRELQVPHQLNFRTKDWGGVEGMWEEIRGFPIPGGDGTLTLRDLIDETPKGQMTKVISEEKVFETWYHCRVV
jgi:hypothetical protein